MAMAAQIRTATTPFSGRGMYFVISGLILSIVGDQLNDVEQELWREAAIVQTLETAELNSPHTVCWTCRVF